MEIIHIAAELAPVAKVGGLGDVIYGLCRAFCGEHHVEVFLPKYDCLDLNGVENLEVIVPSFPSYFEGKWHHNRIWHGLIDGFSTLFFEPNDPYQFFERNTIYGARDDADRFLYFCRLVMEYLAKKKRRPDILHIHDWHAAAIPLIKKHLFAGEISAKTILTIHNLAYQGITPSTSLQKIGISKTLFKENVNLLEEGIIHSDCITTVSPNYAKEILTPLGGKGLHLQLQKYSDKLYGILNGIDENYWNPETDPMLPFHYSSHDPLNKSHPFIEKKGKVQTYVRHMFSLKEKKVPLVGSVTRLVAQKSPELIKHALLWTLENKGQFILLGSALDPKTQEEFFNLKREFSTNSDVHIELIYNEKLSHLVYAASDLFLVPSLFEPCGLTQMIAMRYGSVPLVRETGGLADTVFEDENGFTFGPLTPEAMEAEMEKAFNVWYNEPTKWRSLLSKGMGYDYSWKKSAREYLNLYDQLINQSSLAK